jgi:hypothetical protein
MMANESTALRFFGKVEWLSAAAKAVVRRAGKKYRRAAEVSGHFFVPGNNSSRRRREFRRLLLCMTEKLSMDLRVRHIVAIPDDIIPLHGSECGKMSQRIFSPQQIPLGLS